MATVVATRSSAPRPVGSKLVVSQSGEIAGSVSGGCVEVEVALVAQEVLEDRRPRLLTYGIADDEALTVGLPCGGEVDVFVEPLGPIIDNGVVLTVIAGKGLGSRLVVSEKGDVSDGGNELAPFAAEALERGRRHLIELPDRTVFVDVFGPPPRLLIYGAVDIAEALCRIAKTLGWRTIVADARSAFATRERIPSADELVIAWPAETLEYVKPDHDTAVLVLVHDERFDVPVLQGALATDAFYIGALGSRRNQERRQALLLEAGVGKEELSRIHGPCGLDIGAESPAETALSILAETVAVQSRRSGDSLQCAKQRIHATRP